MDGENGRSQSHIHLQGAHLESYVTYHGEEVCMRYLGHLPELINFLTTSLEMESEFA